MKLKRFMPTAVLPVLALAGFLVQDEAEANNFDINKEMAPFKIVFPAVGPVFFEDVSPTGGDASLVLRITTMLTNAWFDAAAPYDPNGYAVGVYSRINHRPQEELTLANLNTAVIYASYRVLKSLLPARAANWDAMLNNAGLSQNNSEDPTTPVGIGNIAGLGVVEGRERDGMNQLGDEDGRTYNLMPYADYTNYKPVNTAYKLRFPSRWQPDLQRQGMGLYKIQQFVTPQYALTEPYSYPDPRVFSFPRPINSKVWNFRKYKQQADEVLQVSADLNDERKMKAECFDDKLDCVGDSPEHVWRTRIAQDDLFLSLLDFIYLDFLANMAAFDAGITVWQEKRRFDAVRPYSAIRFIYRNKPVTAWGGPGQGTVNDIPANEWKSYLEEADHPEYPSASTCFCYAQAQAMRSYIPLGTATPLGDELNFTVHVEEGSSRIEPGITPASNIKLTFDTWSDFAYECGQSRIWAGVHFQSAVDESAKVCGVFGDMANTYLVSLLDGTAPERDPSQGLDQEERDYDQEDRDDD